MKTTIITELVKLEVLPEAEAEILAKGEAVSSFLQKNNGFLDGELIKSTEGGVWYFIYHFESMDKLKEAGQKLRASGLFNELNSITVPGSLSVTFFEQIRKW